MFDNLVINLQNAMKGKKLIRVAHILDEGLEQTVVSIPQEVWYKYPTLGEDYLKTKIPSYRPFPNINRDREYTYDHLIWKVMASGYLSKMEETPIFMASKNSTNLTEACKEFGVLELMPDYKLFKDLQYKNRLYLYGVDEEHGQIPNIQKKIKDTTYEEIVQILGENFVVQYSFDISGWNTSGGRDVYFVHNKGDFLEAQKDARDIEAKISKFIEGPSFSIIAVAMERGTFVSDFYMQIIGAPELGATNTMYGGVDFTKFAEYKDRIEPQLKKIVKNIGAKIYGKNFKGSFGIDFIYNIKDSKVYVSEINPRFVGSSDMVNFLYKRANKMPQLYLHFAEYLDCVSEDFDVLEYERNVTGSFTGSFLYMKNLTGKTIQIKSAPKPGIYKFEENDVKFLRDGYDISELNEPDTFILYNVEVLQRNIDNAEGICKIQTLESAIESNSVLNEKYRMIVKKVYEKFEFLPAGSYDSSVPYDAA